MLFSLLLVSLIFYYYLSVCLSISYHLVIQGKSHFFFVSVKILDLFIRNHYDYQFYTFKIINNKMLKTQQKFYYIYLIETKLFVKINSFIIILNVLISCCWMEKNLICLKSNKPNIFLFHSHSFHRSLHLLHLKKKMYVSTNYLDVM